MNDSEMVTQAEQAFLALMLDSGARRWGRAAVRPEWFFSPFHRVAFEVAADWDVAHGDLELTSLAWAKLISQKTERPWAEVGVKLADCLYHSASPANVSAYAAMIREDWERREIRRVTQSVATQAGDRRADSVELVAEAVSVAEVLSARSGETIVGSDELLEAARRVERGEVRTGFPDLDRMLIGLRPGYLVTIGARTGLGKSSFAIDVCRNALRDGIPIGYVTTEMEPCDIWTRLRAQGAIPERAYFHFPKRRPTVAKIETEARHWSGIGLLVVDHLQHLVGSSRRSRREEIAEITADLKALARTLRVPVLMLSQLSRISDGNPARPPGLSDLKESGSIEEDSDAVILLHRPGYFDLSANQSEATAFLAKHRHGRTGMVDLAWRGDMTSFASVSRIRFPGDPA